MDEKHHQLVQLAAAEVVKVMRERGMIAGATGGGGNPQLPLGATAGGGARAKGGASGAAAAQINPPLGTCMAGGGGAATAAATALAGIVTANRLQEAMDAAADGVAVLAPEARLSPLANDLARQHRQRVRRADPSDAASQADGGAAPEAALPGSLPGVDAWLYWIMRTCPVAEQVLAPRRAVLTPMSAGPDPGGLPQVIRDLSGAIKSRTAPGGILFVPTAAKALCYANRCPSIRAVVGTCAKAVEHGIDEVGANVLVIEYPHHGPESMAALVDRMVQKRPKVSPQVQRELSELQRCG